MEITQLLHSRTNCLRKFLELSRSFLNEYRSGDLDTLERFQTRRDHILQALRFLDGKIANQAPQWASQEERTKVSEILRQNERSYYSLIRSIQELDQRIISLIQEEKDQVLKEIQSSDKAKAMVRRFKSGATTDPGEYLDGKL